MDFLSNFPISCYVPGVFLRPPAPAPVAPGVVPQGPQSLRLLKRCVFIIGSTVTHYSWI